jgi:hypothetical protein
MKYSEEILASTSNFSANMETLYESLDAWSKPYILHVENPDNMKRRRIILEADTAKDIEYCKFLLNTIFQIRL